MKKIITLLLLIMLFLCSCEKKEYGLIEVNGTELLDYLSNVKGDIVIAFCDDRYDKNTEYLDNLAKVAKNAKENIYYINANHLSAMYDLMLYEYFGMDMVGLHYFAIKDGNQVVNGNYLGNFATLMKDLNGKNYDTKINFTSDEDKNKTTEEAKKLYEEGNISSSLDLINSIWNYQEAKKMYDDNRLYKIIESWEWYQEKDNKISYTALLFTTINNQVYIYNDVMNKDEFEVPESDEYTPYYYKIVDNKLLFSPDSEGEYEELFNIDYLDKDTLILSDKKNKKTFRLKG